MQRKVPLQRRHKRRIDRYASEAWHKAAVSKCCAQCGAKPKSGRLIQGHHVIKKQVLERRCKELYGDQWLEHYVHIEWDRRNLLPLCERCHRRHHDAFRRLPRQLIEEHCRKINQFARELGLEWWLDREYSSSSDKDL
jgi:5-methylcytosine-specific restriction endonuclease McrA